MRYKNEELNIIFNDNNDGTVTVEERLVPGTQKFRDTICEIFGYETGMDEDTFNKEVKIGMVEYNEDY